MTTTNDHTTGSEELGREDTEPEVTVLGDTTAAEADDDPTRSAGPVRLAGAVRTTETETDAGAHERGDGTLLSAEPLATTDATPEAGEDDDDLLLGNGAELFSRWEQIQGRFVDEPRVAVEEADGLVGQVVDDLSRAFADQRERLEHQWKAGQDVSTEDLRRALQRYRAFFQRLVAV